MLLLAAGAAAQEPPHFVAFDASGPPGLASSDLRVSDNRQERQIVYWRANRHAGAPPVTVVVFDLSYDAVKSYLWTLTVNTMRRFETSEDLYFYVVTRQNALLPVRALPDAESASAPVRGEWVDRTLPALEGGLFLESARAKAGMGGVSGYLDLVARMAVFPGRKNLVCIGCLLEKAADWDPKPGASPGLVARAAELRQLGAALVRARVAVYPVAGRPPSGRVGGGSGDGVGMPGASTSAAHLYPGGIGGFAGLTGGRSSASGQIDEAITQAVHDGQSTYRAAYLAPQDGLDGRPHKLAVSSTRKGAQILAPDWYLAPTREELEAELRRPIPDAAINNPVEQTDIAISIAAPVPAGGGFRLPVRVDATDILLLPRNGRYHGSLALQAICYTPEGRAMGCSEPKLVPLDLSEDERQTALRGGLHFSFDLPAAKDGAGKFRVIVRDEYSGAIGTASFVPVEGR